jgi:hypothetical protein
MSGKTYEKAPALNVFLRGFQTRKNILRRFSMALNGLKWQFLGSFWANNAVQCLF